MVTHRVFIREFPFIFHEVIPKNFASQSRQIVTTLNGLPPNITVNVMVCLIFLCTVPYIFLSCCFVTIAKVRDMENLQKF